MKSVLKKIDIWQKDIKKENNVLDISCWSGEKVKILCEKSNNVFGMEIDENKINLAEPKIKKRIKLGDVTKGIPYNKKFDWIFLTEVLEHIPEDKLALKNISNSLKKGGKFILSTPRKVKFFDIWDPAWVGWKLGGDERHYHYTKEELFTKLEKEDLIIRKYYIQGNFYWVLVRWLNVFLKYVLKSKKQIQRPMKEGFCDWVILAKKTEENKKKIKIKNFVKEMDKILEK